MKFFDSGDTRSKLQIAELALRRPLGERYNFVHALVNDGDLALDVADLLLKIQSKSAIIENRVESLETILYVSGSAWKVGREGEFYHLERRVDESVAAAVEEATKQGKSGEHIARAWRACYGRSPQRSQAYREAVKAVEVSSAKIFLPKDNLATLGRVIGHLHANRGRVTLTLNPKGSGKIPPVDSFIGMLELLWHSQWDRHGVPDETLGFEVSDEEAEAAVHLAALLVHWMESGKVGWA